ncbi:MAG: TonB-dependent receptor [Candidatus Aminicenantes bacterium]|nr:TonB-dependent receptor [Candidatus Aminicenantes bacterium]
MGNSVRACSALLFLLFLGAGLQAQVLTGRIIGTVTDEQGAPLPGVSVEAMSPELVGAATAVTEVNGIYRLFALTPGTYRITYTLPGFKTVGRDGIIVKLEQTVKLDIIMYVGVLEEEVTVIGESPLIDVKSTVKGMTQTKEMFELLPRGRNFDTLVTAVPGVSNERLLAGISVDGASGLENMFYVDGTNIGDLLTGARGQDVAFEFVDEIKIKASGYEAEYGGSLGGVITVITRQGGNAFHGGLTSYYSGSALSGKERDTLRLDPDDIFEAEYVNYQDLYGRDEVHRFEAGFHLGGYIIKNRLWFYSSLLPVLRTTDRHVVFDPSGEEGDYTSTSRSMNFQMKLTAQPFRFLRLGISFVNNQSKSRGSLPSRDGFSNPDTAWSDYGFTYPRWTFSGFADLFFGNNMLISLRGGSFYSNTTDQRIQPTGARYMHSGYGTAAFPDIPEEYQRPRNWSSPGASRSIDRQIRQRTHADADVSLFLDLAGEHSWKFGLSWLREGENVYNATKYPQVYLYWGRPAVVWGVNYSGGEYGYYSVNGSELTGPQGSVYNTRGDRWSVYLQDSWTIADKFTLNIGFRAESEYIPNYYEDPRFKDLNPIQFHFEDKIAPRIGFIYDVKGDASLKVFGSFGLYYDVMKLYMAAGSFGGYKRKTAYYSLDTYEWDKIGVDGYYPGNLLTTYDYYPATPEAILGTIDPDLRPMSQREISFGVEKQLLENFSVTVRLVQKHLRTAVEDVGVLIPNVGELYYLANPGYGISLWTTHGGEFDPTYPETPKAKREYWAVNFSLDKRFANRWLAGFSYTLSRLTGNYSGLASSDEGGRASPNVERTFDLWMLSYDKELRAIYGPLATDRPHYLKFYGAYTFPFGLTVGTVVNAMSGTPVSEFWNVMGIGFMPYGRGNLGRAPFLWYANLYAEYTFRLGRSSLSFNINVDNLFDTRTAEMIDSYHTLFYLEVTEEQLLSRNWHLADPEAGFVPNPSYMWKESFFPPIEARLGLRFNF